MRSFDEIIADEKKNRTTLTVTLLKIVKIVNGKEEKEKSLTMEDVGELLFDVVKLNIGDCAGLGCLQIGMTRRKYLSSLI